MEPAPPSAPRRRLRVALLAATVALAGLGFIAGRGTAHPPAAAPAPTSSPATTTTVPGNQHRTLGWSASAGAAKLTLVAISRTTTGGDASGLLTIKVTGLEPGRQVYGIEGLALRDQGGGPFATPDESVVAGFQAVNVGQPSPDGTYTFPIGAIPDVGGLTSASARALVVTADPTARTFAFDASGAWPSRPPLRPVDTTGDDRVTLRDEHGDLGSTLEVRVATVLVGAGRVAAVITYGNLEAPGGVPSPVVIQLRAGARVIATRSVQPQSSGSSPPLTVVSGPSAPASEVEVGVGIGARELPLQGQLVTGG